MRMLTQFIYPAAPSSTPLPSTLFPTPFLSDPLFRCTKMKEMLTPSSDYEGKRQGNRVVSLGEIPYFDPASKSRREALAEEKAAAAAEVAAAA